MTPSPCKSATEQLKFVLVEDVGAKIRKVRKQSRIVYKSAKIL